MLTIDPEGPFSGVSAYYLAVHAFNDSKFDAALPFFRTAIAKLTEPKIKLEAQFFYAQALQLAGSGTEAIAQFRAVLQSNAPAEYRERSELELGKLLQAAGNLAEARQHFANAAETAKKQSIRDEAQFKAGILGLDAEDTTKAEAFLLETLKSSTSDPRFKAQSQLALILRARDRKDHRAVTTYYGAGPLGREKTRSTAQMMMIAADAYRLLNNLGKAIEIYGKIELDPDFRKFKEATEAGYRKLQCFLQAGDKNIARWVDRFVQHQSTIDAETPYIDLALLIKAENLFDIKSFKESARAYRNVRPSNIDPKFVPVRHYKMGWALIESGESEQGLDILGEFANKWPEDTRVPSALVKCALTYQQLDKLDEAQASFKTLADKFPEDPKTEFAMQQIGLIHAQKKRVRPMVDAYRALLARFPETKVKAEANYWIGGGLFDLKDYKQCVAPLDRARQLDAKQFGPKATLRIVLAHYHLDQLEPLEKEVKNFLGMPTGELKLPIQVFAHLGRQLFDQGELLRSRMFLRRASNPNAPQNTPPDIWEKLFTIHLQSQEWREAIQTLDYYLIHEQHPVKRADAMLKKASAQVKLGQTAEAEAVGKEVLKLVRTGRSNSEARVLLGDLAMAAGDPKQAVRFYVIVVELGTDPVAVPEALTKLIAALNALNEPIKAQEYQRQLEARFPNYEPKA